MGQYANFYNSKEGDRVYNADSMSEWLQPFFTSGIFNNCFPVTANNDMSVTVSGGYVNIKGKTKYFEQAQIITLAKASGTLARIDNVILRRDDTQRDFYIFIQPGEFAKNPVAPEIVRAGAVYDLKLGEIYVDVGAIKITQENITDTRMDQNLCGWVMATVKEIDFSQITAQFQSFFVGYKANIEQEFNTYMNQISNFGNQGLVAYKELQGQFESYMEQQEEQFTAWFESIKDLLPEGSTEFAVSMITGLQEELDSKVEKVSGKSLSTNDYTSTEKNKLAAIAINHASTGSTYGLGNSTSYGHVKLIDSIISNNASSGIVNSPYVVYQLNQQLQTKAPAIQVGTAAPTAVLASGTLFVQVG